MHFIHIIAIYSLSTATGISPLRGVQRRIYSSSISKIDISWLITTHERSQTGPRERQQDVSSLPWKFHKKNDNSQPMWKFHSFAPSARHSLTLKMMQSSIHWQLNVFPKRWNSSRKESEDWRHHQALRCQKQRIPQRQIRLTRSKSERGIFPPSPMIKESVMFHTIDELTFVAILFTLSPSFSSLLFCCTFHARFKRWRAFSIVHWCIRSCYSRHNIFITAICILKSHLHPHDRVESSNNTITSCDLCLS